MQSKYRFTQKLTSYQQQFTVPLTDKMEREDSIAQFREMRDITRQRRNDHEDNACYWVVPWTVITAVSFLTGGISQTLLSAFGLAVPVAYYVAKARQQEKQSREYDRAYAVLAKDLSDVTYSHTIRQLKKDGIIEKKAKPHWIEQVKWYTPPL